MSITSSLFIERAEADSRTNKADTAQRRSTIPFYPARRESIIMNAMASDTTGRRAFLKKAALAGALAGEQVGLGAEHTGASNAGEYPRVYTGRQLHLLAFPLGGVGAGSISLGGRGQLRDWEIFNRPDKGNVPQYAFASIWAQSGSSKPVARVLEARLQPPYEGPSGLGSNNVPGLPRLETCRFTGEYPLARIDFEDRDLPVKVALEALSPFIPLEADDSGLPAAILRYRVSNPGSRKSMVSIAFSLDNVVGREGRSNSFQQSGPLQGLVMKNPFAAKADPLSGSFTLAILGANDAQVTYLRGWRSGSGWRVGPLAFWDDFSRDGQLGAEAPVKDAVGSLCVKREIGARAEAEFTFVLAWHFPNRTPERCGWRAPKGQEKAVIGNWYTTKFADSWAVAQYLATNLDDLEKRTRVFVTTMRESTLPAAVREGAMANLSTLATPTCFRTADGNFHGFEGSNNQSGCCFGNCNHVWNYEAASSCLFPTLARSLREASFGFCTDERGKMDIRQILPAGQEHFEYAAADGQMGQIMRLYHDYRLSGDRDWLAKMWPAAKRAIEFAWVPGGWDANRDGVMEGVQHNTYDVEFYGPNPLCGVWYLGALRASEEMARVMGDAAFADECHRLFQSGSQWIDANLFNGEYYIQKIQGVPRDKIAAGLISGMGAANAENPDFQVGDGCLVDQLLGQYFAHLVDLGPLLDRDHVRKALQSIYRYNYKRNLYDWESVQRVYALNDEAALVICDYANRPRPEIPFPYFAEVMTGFEYAAASLMIAEGMIPQGIEVFQNVRRRYDGERRNPWNEAECGHHYARAMASWSSLLMLSGFQYHGGTGSLAAKPRINARKFRSFWSTAGGWGSFGQVQRPQSMFFDLTVHSGSLSLQSIELSAPPARGAGSRVKVQNVNVAHRIESVNSALRLTLDSELVLKTGDRLTISV
jgi:uncharacterized protein (DUF608 family)